jgi:hypothetical protein
MQTLFSKLFLCFLKSATAASVSQLNLHPLLPTHHTSTTSALSEYSQSLSFKPLPRESTKAIPITTLCTHFSTLSSKAKAMVPNLETALAPKTANFSHISKLLEKFVQPPKLSSLQVIEKRPTKLGRKTTKYDFIRPALLYPGPPLKLAIPKLSTFPSHPWPQNNWFYNSDRVDGNMSIKTRKKHRGSGKRDTKGRNALRFPSGRFRSPVLDEVLKRSQTPPDDSDDENYKPLDPRDYRQPSHPLQRSVVVYADRSVDEQKILEALARHGVVTRLWAAHPLCPVQLHTAVFQTHAQARTAVRASSEIAWNQTIIIQEGDVRSDEAIDGWALWMGESC